MRTVPLLEQSGGDSERRDSSSEATVTASRDEATSSAGPSVSLQFSEGSEMTLTDRDLMLLLTLAQTTLLLYVTYKEATE